MMNLATLQRGFSQLQPRERLIIVLGTVLVAAAAVYLALAPLLERHTELQSRQQQLTADMRWLQAQSDTVARLGSSCQALVPQKGSDKDVITRLVRRNLLTLVSLQAQGSGAYRVTAEGRDANRLLELVHQVSCQGLALTSLDVKAAAKIGTGFTAVIEVTHVN
tara:strand:- start:4740 stop:5231 length:492 start_codon:yes stop_codon:yes gene_type:complete